MKPTISSMLPGYRFLKISAAAIAVLSVALVKPLAAGEPYQKFLQKLREQRMFELALVYLEDSEKRSGLDENFKTAIELERALLFFESASMLSLRSPQRAEKLNESEKHLRSFITEFPKHPRRSEARLKLGALLQLRAEEAINLAGSKKEQGVPAAQNFYDAAQKLYEEAIAELAQIEGELRGGRVDSQDKEKVAYRNQVRLELREAQLYSAKAIEDRGRARAENDPARKADLEKAIELYSELYRKESGLAGIRSFALLYRSGAQVTLGKLEDAIDGYQRIIDLENADQLRPLQFTALTEMIQVLATQEKYQPAVERAETWITKLRPDEREIPEVIALKMAYAKVRIQWLKKLKTDGDDKLASRLDKAVRGDLRALMRVAGEHTEEAKNLLSSLGAGGPTEKSAAEIPKLKNLGEALEESQKRLEDADAEALNLAVLDEQIASAQGQEKQDYIAQRDVQQAQIDQMRQTSLEILRIGLTKYDNKKDDRAQLFNARFRMAYLLLKLRDTREAIVIADFLCRTSPGTPQGLNAGSIVLQAFSDLLKRKDVDTTEVMTELSPFSEYLVSTWPQSAEAVAASGALAQLAIVSKDWDKAEKYLGVLPTSSAGIGKHYFDLGAAIYDQYRKMIAEKSGDDATINSLRDRAGKWLQLAIDNLGTDDPTTAIGAARALAQVRLAQNETDKAAQVLLDADKAPMKWIDSKLDSISPLAAMDTYRTAIQIVIQQVVDKKTDPANAEKAILGYVAKLQEIGSKSDEDRQRMTAIFGAIAADLKDKLSKLDKKVRSDLGDVMMVIASAAAESGTYNMMNWAANTLISLGEGNEENGKSTKFSEKAYGKASELLQKMLDQNEKQPGWIPASSMMSVRILKARACEGNGDFTGAIKEFAAILDENDGLLEPQMAVARVLQKSAQNNPSYYKTAIAGARPNPKTKRNVFWGWGKIGQITNNKIDQYGEQFFEARYQLANCRMLYAMTLKDPKDRSRELASAEKSINETKGLYPNLGGPEDLKRYDALLKQIQKEMGK